MILRSKPHSNPICVALPDPTGKYRTAPLPLHSRPHRLTGSLHIPVVNCWLLVIAHSTNFLVLSQSACTLIKITTKISKPFWNVYKCAIICQLLAFFKVVVDIFQQCTVRLNVVWVRFSWSSPHSATPPPAHRKQVPAGICKSVGGTLKKNNIWQITSSDIICQKLVQYKSFFKSMLLYLIL